MFFAVSFMNRALGPVFLGRTWEDAAWPFVTSRGRYDCLSTHDFGDLQAALSGVGRRWPAYPLLPKLYVEGSIPFARSNIPLHNSPYISSKKTASRRNNAVQGDHRC